MADLKEEMQDMAMQVKAQKASLEEQIVGLHDAFDTVKEEKADLEEQMAGLFGEFKRRSAGWGVAARQQHQAEVADLEAQNKD